MGLFYVQLDVTNLFQAKKNTKKEQNYCLCVCVTLPWRKLWQPQEQNASSLDKAGRLSSGRMQYTEHGRLRSSTNRTHTAPGTSVLVRHVFRAKHFADALTSVALHRKSCPDLVVLQVRSNWQRWWCGFENRFRFCSRSQSPASQWGHGLRYWKAGCPSWDSLRPSRCPQAQASLAWWPYFTQLIGKDSHPTPARTVVEDAHRSPCNKGRGNTAPRQTRRFRFGTAMCSEVDLANCGAES